MLPRRDSQSCTLAPAKLKRFGWGGIWKRRPSHCTTLSLLTMRSWTKQQMRLRSLGAVRQAFSVSRGARPKRRVLLGREGRRTSVAGARSAGAAGGGGLGKEGFKKGPQTADGAPGRGGC